MHKKRKALMETFSILMGLALDNTHDCISMLVSSLIHGFWAILALIGSFIMAIVVVIAVFVGSFVGLFRPSTAK